MLHTHPDDDAFVETMIGHLHNRPLILFHNGTTWDTKLWSVPGWTALAREVLQRIPGAEILLTWGNEAERERAQLIRDGGGERVHLLDKLSLGRLIALLKRMDLVVGGDTGPVHLAAAVGTPTVSFYRCTDGSLNGPAGEMHRIVQSPLACTACLNKRCDRDDECSASITVAAMLDGIMAVHAKLHHSPGRRSADSSP
jgi:heptosyltransferase-1